MYSRKCLIVSRECLVVKTKKGGISIKEVSLLLFGNGFLTFAGIKILMTER